MRIDKIVIRELHLPLVHSFETSFGLTTVRKIILVEVFTEGVRTWGESVAGESPLYSEESHETAWYALTQLLAPSIVGQVLASAAHVQSKFPPIKGHRMAKAAIENALWEAEALLSGVSLWRLLGGIRSEIVCGVSIGIQPDIDALLRKVDSELQAGYQRIKLKCKPGLDLELFRAVRARWPNILLSCDANSAYRMDDLDLLKRFDAFNLLMIEQPLWADDIYFHSKLQRELTTRICLDESIRHARDAQAAIELGACGIINIKVGRVGGMGEALRVHDIAQNSGVPVWCGGMLESGVGRWHNVALSTLPNFLLPGDVSASKRYWAEDIVDPAVEVRSNGTIAAPDAAGGGYQVKEALVEQLTVRKRSFPD